MFDVDRTLAEPHGSISDDLVSELGKLHAPAGVATARTLTELEESLPPGKRIFDIFKGDLLLEDGGVVVPRGQSGKENITLNALVSQVELGAISTFREVLKGAFVDLNREDGFGNFRGLPQPLVKFPPFNDFLTSITVWEKGPVGDSSFALAYQWVAERLKESNLDSVLALTEVGDGTLRITKPNANKGWGLQQLAERRGLDLSKVAYFGDGANDIPAALTVREKGGLVIAVGRATPRLVALADYTTDGEGPDAVLNVLTRLNRITR
jgi:hydroxymethylpyrimidine pyrophosphatase-like HAD family hydrolase